MAESEVASPPSGRLAELRLSARGWHGVQLAVIGFVGLCGVIKRETPSVPTWLEVLSGILVLVSLFLACLATYLVGRVAWPLYDPRRRAGTDDDDPGEIVRSSRRLTRGLLLTFVAVALVALASAASWWPSKEEGGGAAGAAFVEVQAQGSSFCGTLGESPPGTVRVEGGDQPVQVAIDALSSIQPVDGC
jgi:hypothetical protein